LAGHNPDRLLENCPTEYVKIVPAVSRQLSTLVRGPSGHSSAKGIDSARPCRERIVYARAYGIVQVCLLRPYPLRIKSAACPRISRRMRSAISTSLSGARKKDPRHRSGVLPKDPLENLAAGTHRLSSSTKHWSGGEADVSGRYQYFSGVVTRAGKKPVLSGHPPSRDSVSSSGNYFILTGIMILLYDRCGQSSQRAPAGKRGTDTYPEEESGRDQAQVPQGT